MQPTFEQFAALTAQPLNQIFGQIAKNQITRQTSFKIFSSEFSGFAFLCDTSKRNQSDIIWAANFIIVGKVRQINSNQCEPISGFFHCKAPLITAEIIQIDDSGFTGIINIGKQRIRGRFEFNNLTVKIIQKVSITHQVDKWAYEGFVNSEFEMNGEGVFSDEWTQIKGQFKNGVPQISGLKISQEWRVITNIEEVHKSISWITGPDNVFKFALLQMNTRRIRIYCSKNVIRGDFQFVASTILQGQLQETDSFLKGDIPMTTNEKTGHIVEHENSSRPEIQQNITKIVVPELILSNLVQRCDKSGQVIRIILYKNAVVRLTERQPGVFQLSIYSNRFTLSGTVDKNGGKTFAQISAKAFVLGGIIDKVSDLGFDCERALELPANLSCALVGEYKGSKKHGTVTEYFPNYDWITQKYASGELETKRSRSFQKISNELANLSKVQLSSYVKTFSGENERLSVESEESEEIDLNDMSAKILAKRPLSFAFDGDIKVLESDANLSFDKVRNVQTQKIVQKEALHAKKAKFGLQVIDEEVEEIGENSNHKI